MSKQKRAYPLDAKTTFGLSTMRWAIVTASSLMTSAFMLCHPFHLFPFAGRGVG